MTAKNEAQDVCKVLRLLLPTMTHTNVIVATLPYRYDLPDFSCVNVVIKEINSQIAKLCKHFKNVRLLDMYKIPRTYHTEHGLHLNKFGKRYISGILLRMVQQASQPSVISLPYGSCNQDQEKANEALREMGLSAIDIENLKKQLPNEKMNQAQNLYKIR